MKQPYFFDSFVIRVDKNHKKKIDYDQKIRAFQENNKVLQLNSYI